LSRLYIKINRHVNCIYILVNEQFGFRNNQSAGIASYDSTNDVRSLLNSKLLVDGVLNSVQKAFHQIVYRKHFIIIIIYSFRRSVQDYKIQMDMEIVTFEGKRVKPL
jgi:hypothetical protein